MTSVESKENCKYPYTCYNKKCGGKHPVPYETRSDIADLANKGDYPKEEKTEERKCFCRFGPLCYNPKCGFRHPFSKEGREMLQKDLKKRAEKSKKEKVDAPESFNCDEVEKSKKEKKVKVDAPESVNYYDKVFKAYYDLGERYGISAEDPSYEVIRVFIESKKEV